MAVLGKLIGTYEKTRKASLLEPARAAVDALVARMEDEKEDGYLRIHTANQWEVIQIAVQQRQLSGSGGSAGEDPLHAATSWIKALGRLLKSPDEAVSSRALTILSDSLRYVGTESSFRAAWGTSRPPSRRRRRRRIRRCAARPSSSWPVARGNRSPGDASTPGPSREGPGGSLGDRADDPGDQQPGRPHGQESGDTRRRRRGPRTSRVAHDHCLDQTHCPAPGPGGQGSRRRGDCPRRAPRAGLVGDHSIDRHGDVGPRLRGPARASPPWRPSARAAPPRSRLGSRHSAIPIPTSARRPPSSRGQLPARPSSRHSRPRLLIQATRSQ